MRAAVFSGLGWLGFDVPFAHHVLSRFDGGAGDRGERGGLGGDGGGLGLGGGLGGSGDKAQPDMRSCSREHTKPTPRRLSPCLATPRPAAAQETERPGLKQRARQGCEG